MIHRKFPFPSCSFWWELQIWHAIIASASETESVLFWFALACFEYFLVPSPQCEHVAMTGVVDLCNNLVVQAMQTLLRAWCQFVSSVWRSFLWASMSHPDSSISNHNLIPWFMSLKRHCLSLICNSPRVEFHPLNRVTMSTFSSWI